MTALREALTAAIAAAAKYESAKGSVAKISYQESFDLLSDTFAATLIAIRDHGPELLAALDDAERYRWLRPQFRSMRIDMGSDHGQWHCGMLAKGLRGPTIDAAIDAARKP